MSYCCLGQNKAYEALKYQFRLLKFRKAATGLDYAHHKEQYQQGISNGL